MDLDFKYLQLLEKNKIRPNFWCSNEYFNRAGFGEICNDNVYYIIDETGEYMLPGIMDDKDVGVLVGTKDIWADFSQFEAMGLRKGNHTTFLDYEYIYNPKHFLNMKGKKWQTFRKNCRKYPNRCDEPLYYVKYDSEIMSKKLDEFLEIWSESIKWDDVQDGYVMMDYTQNGNNREVLIDYFGDIHGMNIFDSNYMFINYRYCVCLDIPFLSEYMRYLFYIYRCEQDKLVNDGGVLDNDNLKKFKDKLNPVEVNKIYTWKF